MQVWNAAKKNEKQSEFATHSDERIVRVVSLEFSQRQDVVVGKYIPSMSSFNCTVSYKTNGQSCLEHA